MKFIVMDSLTDEQPCGNAVVQYMKIGVHTIPMWVIEIEDSVLPLRLADIAQFMDHLGPSRGLGPVVILPANPQPYNEASQYPSIVLNYGCEPFSTRPQDEFIQSLQLLRG